MGYSETVWSQLPATSRRKPWSEAASLQQRLLTAPWVEAPVTVSWMQQLSAESFPSRWLMGCRLFYCDLLPYFSLCTSQDLASKLLPHTKGTSLRNNNPRKRTSCRPWLIHSCHLEAWGTEARERQVPVQCGLKQSKTLLKESGEDSEKREGKGLFRT